LEMTDSEIEAIKERLSRATPGPWTVIAEGYDGVGDFKMGPDGAEVVTLDLGGIAYCSDPYPRGDNCPSENMMFIAHSREDVPRLIAALEAVTRERDELRVQRGALAEYAEQVRANGGYPHMDPDTVLCDFTDDDSARFYGELVVGVKTALAAAEAKLAACAAEAAAHEELASQFSRGNDDVAVIHRLAARGIRAALDGAVQS